MRLSCFILSTGSTASNYRQILREGYKRCEKAFSMWVVDLRIAVFLPVVVSLPESQALGILIMTQHLIKTQLSTNQKKDVLTFPEITIS